MQPNHTPSHTTNMPSNQPLKACTQTLIPSANPLRHLLLHTINTLIHPFSLTLLPYCVSPPPPLTVLCIPPSLPPTYCVSPPPSLLRTVYPPLPPSYVLCDHPTGEKSKLDAAEARVKLLERQRADLIAAFKVAHPVNMPHLCTH